MIAFEIDGCHFDLIPFIKGLVSEKHQVIDALNNNEYEATGVALGFEDIEAIKIRKTIIGDFQPSELDEVYSYILKRFGDIDMPDPASTCLIDICVERNIPVNPLDMNDETYSKLYCDTVTTWEFMREKKVIKKALKKKFTTDSPITFVEEWDDLVNEVKGYEKMSAYREAYMADQIIELAKYRKKVLLAIEYERVKGVLGQLGVKDVM